MSATIQKMPSTTQQSPWTVAEMRINLENAKYYKSSFVKVATALRIPAYVLVGKAAVESGGKQFIRVRGGSVLDRSLTPGFPENDGFVGLMQVGRIPCESALGYISDSGTYSMGRLLKAPKDMQSVLVPYVQRFLPNFDPKNKTSALANRNAAFELAKTNSEFNILIGGIIMALLLYNPRYNVNNIIRLDKISSAYNTGEGYKAYDKVYADTTALINALPGFLNKSKVPETRGHILKLCGVNGAYDLLQNGKFVF